MIFQDRIDGLRQRYDRLSQRERTMVLALGVSFVVMLTLIVGFLVTDGISSIEERNADIRQALRDLETQRDTYLKSRSKAAQLETRLGHGSAQLGGFLEQAAKDSGIQIPEQNERPPAPAGKQWTEKAIDLRLQKVKLDELATFLKKIETGPNLVVVTALSIRTRDDKHEELDVEMTVATYDRAAKGKEGGKKGDKS